MATITVNGLNGLSAADTLDVYWYLVTDTESWGDIGSPIQSGSTAWAKVDGNLTFTISFSQADGSYNLLIFTDVDSDTNRTTGDTYLEYSLAIAGSAITKDPIISDWSIYLDTSGEYVGWTSEKLWDYIPESIRQKDKDTALIKVNGTDRGQFERYVMSISRAMSQIIGNSIYARRSHAFLYALPAFLYKVLESRGLPFDSDWSAGRQRIVYEDSVYSNKLAGNIRALNALAYRFFGWEIVDKSFKVDQVFVLNTGESIFYTEGSPEAGGTNAGDDTAYSSGNYTGGINTIYTVTVTTGGALGGTAEVTITSTGAEIVNDTANPSDDTFFDLGTLGAKLKFVDGGDGNLTLDDVWTLEAHTQKLLYDPDIHGDLSEATYIVNYHSDPDFATKQADFESFISNFLPSGFTFSFTYI